MKILYVQIIASILLISLGGNAFAQQNNDIQVSNSGTSGNSKVQRMRSNCNIFYSKEKGKRQCVYAVSFIALISDPEKYNNKIVAVKGYLISDFGNLILYPSKISYKGNRSIERISLKPPFSIDRKIIKKAKTGVYPVLIVANFNSDPLPAGTSIPRLGTFYNIRKIVLTPRVPSGNKLDMHGIKIIQER